MKVLHIYAHENGNWGDRALARGTQEVFKKYLGIQEFNIVSVETLVNNQDKLLNQDLIIYGGGGIIGELMSAYKGFLSSFPSPIVGYAVGANRFIVPTGREEPYEISDLKLLNYVVKRDFKYFSVRNDGTKEKLLAWGYEPPLNESPCVGLWSGLNLPNTTTSNSKNYVIIQLAGDMLLNRFYYDGIDMVKFTRKIDSVKNFLNNKGYDVMFAIHRSEDTVYKRFISKNYREWNWSEMINNIPHGLQSYKNAKFVIGMRGHAQILPFGFNVPPIALVNQSKNLGFMQKVGLERYAVNINEKRLDTILKVKILELENEYPLIQKHIQSQLQIMDKNVTEEFKVIKEKLNW